MPDCEEVDIARDDSEESSGALPLAEEIVPFSDPKTPAASEGKDQAL